MIKQQVIGHLGKDAEVNNVNGRSVINFSLAHTEKYRDAQNQQKEKTVWVECAYWTDKTGVAPYLKKGAQVYVDGQPDVRLWTSSQGKSGASMVLRVATIQLLGGNPNSAGNSSNAVNEMTQRSYGGGNNTSANDLTEPLDDLPF